MKKILLLGILTLGVILFIPQNVEAQTENFYEGEFINNIWMIRKKNNRIIYQTARFLRRSSDQQFAYCMEPFSLMNDGVGYETTLNPDIISKSIWEQVSLIAYYGYGYQSHSANKWYAITQMLIWQALDPSSEFYFTDSLNGNKIDIFQSEMQEILNLVQQHRLKPSFNNQVITMVLGTTKTIIDNNQILNTFKINTNNENITQNQNTLTINAIKVGEQEITLTKEENLYHTPPIFYYHPINQNLMTVGNISTIDAKIKIQTINTKIIINKVDKDTKDKINQGEAKLEGAIYDLYNNQHKYIKSITIDEQKEAIIENLDFGTYYLKEQKPGIGYQLNQETYKFEITKEKPIIELTLDNEVIKRKIQIYKKYGNPSSSEMLPEPNIIFEVYNQNNKLVTNIITDINGFGEITLPYGTYTVKQINTTEGYQKVDDFVIEINEKTDEILIYQLDNLEIPVPNTSERKNITQPIIGIILNTIGLYYVKKKNYFSITYSA